MMGQPSELEALAFHWADAYLISYVRDRWVALRRDTRRFLIADTLTGLEHAIQDDYRHHPVSRDCDPRGAADYLNLPEDGDLAGDGDVPDEESQFILAALRYAFPSWTIRNSALLWAWIARAHGMTICQNSPVLLCAALLIERRQPSGRHGPLR